jgi:tRNA threonylcarbamoyladenosine biosynthesis protein TsaB
VLAIDTATEACSVALARDGQISERTETVGQKHSERLLPLVQQMLGDAGLILSDCDAIAFGAGPGAFTGLRIACGVAQGLAFGAGRPVVAVGNLEALALAASRDAPAARTVLVAIDARMQEAYWALYSVDHGDLAEVTAPALAAADALAEICRDHAPDLAAGNAFRTFQQAIGTLACATAPEASASASSIAALALRKLAQGGAVAAELAAPIYVRDRVALTIDERRSLFPGEKAGRAGAR